MHGVRAALRAVFETNVVRADLTAVFEKAADDFEERWRQQQAEIAQAESASRVTHGMNRGQYETYKNNYVNKYGPIAGKRLDNAYFTSMAKKIPDRYPMPTERGELTDYNRLKGVRDLSPRQRAFVQEFETKYGPSARLGDFTDKQLSDYNLYKRMDAAKVRLEPYNKAEMLDFENRYYGPEYQKAHERLKNPELHPLPPMLRRLSTNKPAPAPAPVPAAPAPAPAPVPAAPVTTVKQQPPARGQVGKYLSQPNVRNALLGAGIGGLGGYISHWLRGDKGKDDSPWGSILGGMAAGGLGGYGYQNYLKPAIARGRELLPAGYGGMPQ